jgi:phosphatidylinositol alpha-1,6-mannosyltransferase
MRRPIRVLVVTADFPPDVGGIQLLIWRVVSGLQQLVPIIVTKAAPAASRASAPIGFRTIRLSPRWSKLPNGLQHVILNALAIRSARERPSIILCGHIVLVPASIILSRLLGVPMVLYLYGEEVSLRPHLSALGIRFAWRTICISRFTESLARRAACQGHIVRIPCGVDLPQVKVQLDRPGPPTILTVARLVDSYKGHDVMLQAMPRILDRVPLARWVIVGDGPLRPALEVEAQRLGVSHAVSFVGSLPDAERDALYSQAHVFVMPSRLSPSGGGEGFGIVFLEAAAHGVPSVTARVGGAAEAVVDGETGLLVDPTSPAEVATAIIRILTDDALRRRLGSAGRSFAEAHSWSAVSAAVERVLLQALGVSDGDAPG